MPFGKKKGSEISPTFVFTIMDFKSFEIEFSSIHPILPPLTAVSDMLFSIATFSNPLFLISSLRASTVDLTLSFATGSIVISDIKYSSIFFFC